MKNSKVCPHMKSKIFIEMQKVKEIPKRCEMPHLKTVEDNGTVWLCCECLEKGCSRYSTNQCMLKHNTEKKHKICFNFKENILWCYKCNDDLYDMLEYCDNKESTLYKNFEVLIDKFNMIIHKIRKKEKLYKNSVDTNKVVISNYHQKKQNQSKEDSFQTRIFGLSNLGNTCFFNSVMQSILASGLFLEQIGKFNSYISRSSLLNEIYMLANAKSRSKNPKSVFKKLVSKNRKYGYYKQQDANECFLYMLEMIEKEYKNMNIQIEHPFNSYSLYQVQCMKCNMIEYIFEISSLMMLGLNEKQSHTKIKDDIYIELDNYTKKSLYFELENSKIKDNKNVIRSRYNRDKD